MTVEPLAEADAAGAGADATPARVQLPVPIDVRSASLALIALLASIYALRWASAVFIPLLMGVMFSYALSPLVDRLQCWRLPRALGAALLLAGLLGGVGWSGYALNDDAAALFDSLPDAAQKLHDSLRIERGAPEGTIQKVQRAAAKLEQANDDSAAVVSTAAKGVTRVQIERPHFNVKDYLWSGTLGLAGFTGQALVVVFITYLLMTADDSFRRKMVRIAGPTFSQKKITLQLFDEITAQIHRYLMVQVFTSARWVWRPGSPLPGSGSSVRPYWAWRRRYSISCPIWAR